MRHQPTTSGITYLIHLVLTVITPLLNFENKYGTHGKELSHFSSNDQVEYVSTDACTHLHCFLLSVITFGTSTPALEVIVILRLGCH